MPAVQSWGLLDQVHDGSAAPIEWWEIESADLDLRFRTPREALLGRANGQGDYLHLSVDYAEQIEIARALQSIAPSVAVCWAIYQAASFHPQAYGLTSTQADVLNMDGLAMLQHYNAILAGKIAEQGAQGQLCYMWEKAWCIDPQMLVYDQTNGTSLQGACNFGMIAGDRPVQSPGSKHNKYHRDYSQWCSGLVLCEAQRISTGEAVDMRDFYVAQWPALAPYVDAYR